MVSLRTYLILKKRVVKHNGYFLYPPKLLLFFQGYKVQDELMELNTLLTLNNYGHLKSTIKVIERTKFIHSDHR